MIRRHAGTEEVPFKIIPGDELDESTASNRLIVSKLKRLARTCEHIQTGRAIRGFRCHLLHRAHPELPTRNERENQQPRIRSGDRIELAHIAVAGIVAHPVQAAGVKD